MGCAFHIKSCSINPSFLLLGLGCMIINLLDNISSVSEREKPYENHFV